ncbi:hypothetical protein K504DRAFT_91527 [Pleomassaria siparia CBS 279.74]|uniref:Uncharacterized protein n=1 Tax=Pleomassaria siparia CBS 279.74 TaxID=1314801 RepID=A0A6G1JZ55_9PLEO|nr:hypothetical protein K504DRAFT_91527 [Pleomassaria siparia CBS 279.74]
MALRRQSLSPTANLLRNSRLFSLPTPLPRPSISEESGIGTQRNNDSATLPYPIHQAIATTPKSLARGDWGFKRPLPSRSYLVQTSNPVVRITQLDTIEHITDFDSAADHVRTREKWEELGIPMMKGMGRMSDEDLTNNALKSAFERNADITSYDIDEGLDEAGMFLKVIRKNAIKNAQSTKTGSYTPFTPPKIQDSQRQSKRWKHDGPWLPGMSADDFTTFINAELSKRRKEFNKILVEFAKNQIYITRQASSSAKMKDEPLPLDPIEAEQMQVQRSKAWSNITEADIAATIRNLRRDAANDPLNSRLVKNLIIPFLHLPPMKVKDTRYGTNVTTATSREHRFTSDTTPSSTHPSAGLGYLRANATLSNHPILGPQALPGPVLARVIQPLHSGSSSEREARLGVAGFVANDEFKAANMQWNRFESTQNMSDVAHIDTETVGGRKLYVQAEFGSVTPTGRVHLQLKRAFGEEVKVVRGELDRQPPTRENFESEGDALSGLVPPPSPLKVSSNAKVLGEGDEEGKMLLQKLLDMSAARDARMGRTKDTREVGKPSPLVQDALSGEEGAR